MFAYRFDPDAGKPGDEPVTMAWAIELERRAIPLAGGEDALFANGGAIGAMTMLGERKTIEEPEGRQLALGPVPVYLFRK